MIGGGYVDANYVARPAVTIGTYGADCQVAADIVVKAARLYA